MHDEAEHAGPAEEAVPAPGRRRLGGRLGRGPAGQPEERAAAAAPAATARPLLVRAVTRLLREKVAHIEGPEEGDRDREVRRPRKASSGSGAGRSLARPQARCGVARPAHTHAHTGTHATVGGGRQLRAARAPDGGYMLCPGKPGERWARALGTRRRERACRLGDQSKPGSPAQSVSAAAGGTRGPARTILTAAPPAARAPATLLGAAGARGPLEEGAELAAAARSGPARGRPAAHRGRPLGRDCWEEADRLARGVLGERREPLPPSPKVSRRPMGPRLFSEAGGDASEPAV